MIYKILDVDKLTVNERIYPKKVIMDSINSDMIKEYIADGGFPVFKLNYADILKATSTSAFDMKKCVGFAKKFDLSDTALYADIEFINDYSPKQVYALGNGTTSFINNTYIVDTYDLIALHVEE